MPTVPDGLHVDELALDPSGLFLLARTTAAQAVCPTCGYASFRIHSRYWRTLQDLPWQDRAVTWRDQVRRFRCSHCPGQIFVERIPGSMGSKARRTERLSEAQTEIGMVLGGEAGARLSRRLCMPVSGDTVLRLIRRHPPRAYPAPRVVGIDDWAWWRGRRYGTIACDLGTSSRSSSAAGPLVRSSQGLALGASKHRRRQPGPGRPLRRGRPQRRPRCHPGRRPLAPSGQCLRSPPFRRCAPPDTDPGGGRTSVFFR